VELHARLPFADLSKFEQHPEVSAISDLFTVDMITRYIQSKLGQPSTTTRPRPKAAAFSTSDIFEEGGQVGAEPLQLLGIHSLDSLQMRQLSTRKI
jgi:hypothetical protein